MIYQYLILRYVHNISTEEFVNIGILMWLPHEKRVFSEVSERYSRLSCFFEGFDGHKYRNMIRRLQSRLRSAEKSDSVPCQWESITNAAEFVLSKSPSCFQWSELMGGIAEEPVIRLKAIFADIVDRHYEKSERTRRSEHDIYRSMHKRLLQRLRTENLHKEIHENIEVQGQHFGHTFKLGWQNGTSQFLEPISFDYAQGSELVEKAYAWSGRLADLERSQDFKMTGVVAPPQHQDLLRYYEEAVKILEESPSIREVVPEDKFDAFVTKIERELKVHRPS